MADVVTGSYHLLGANMSPPRDYDEDEYEDDDDDFEEPEDDIEYLMDEY